MKKMRFSLQLHTVLQKLQLPAAKSHLLSRHSPLACGFKPSCTLRGWQWVVLVLGFAFNSCAIAEASDAAVDLGRAERQFRDFYTNFPDAYVMRDSGEKALSPEQAMSFSASLGEDGRWPDIYYDSTAKSSWPPFTHWSRLQAMATAKSRSGIDPVERAKLMSSIHRAISHWIQRDYQCKNWWYNQIGVPKVVGTTLLLLGDEATPEERHYATAVSLARYRIAQTGQNKIWLAINTVMRGLLLRDEALVGTGVGAVWSELEITTKEGLQPDFSFHQHGAQQQFGTYGLSYAVCMALWARVFDGTRWQMTPPQKEVLRGYLLEGHRWVSWNGIMDISACGRQLMPGSQHNKARIMTLVMQQALGFDPTYTPDYLSFISNNARGEPDTLIGLKHFWRSDYMVIRRPDFMASLKMSSQRVVGTECVNRENLSGYHLGDGALYLYRRGDEYEDIFPLWNWSRLPGVTCVQAPPPAFHATQVPSEFVGGLSDGASGLAALDYRRKGVAARKAWFFYRDTIVCLGADIRGDSPAGLATTVNQAHLRGAVTAHTGAGKKLVAHGNQTFDGEVVIEHDGWRYTIASGSQVRLETGPVSGHWNKVYQSPGTPSDKVNGSLFSLWIDHGVRAEGSGYAYTVSLAESDAVDSPRVLANSRELQAVAYPNGQVAVVYWQAGTFALPDGTRLSVSNPCLVLIDKATARVVDPTQRLQHITLTRNDVPRELSLPVGPSAGSPAIVQWR
jgi:chondroitin AC lyase